MLISNLGIALIKKFENFKGIEYLCSSGFPTIGYGHRILKGESFKFITEPEAIKLLRNDLNIVETYLNSVIRESITQDMFDSLASLIYNWGCAAFGNSKGLKFLNKNQFSLAAIEFFSREKGVVNSKGKFSNGLYKRRQAELNLWRS